MSLTLTVGAPTDLVVGASESEECRVAIELGATNAMLLLTLARSEARELLVQLREVLRADLEL